MNEVHLATLLQRGRERDKSVKIILHVCWHFFISPLMNSLKIIQQHQIWVDAKSQTLCLCFTQLCCVPLLAYGMGRIEHHSSEHETWTCTGDRMSLPELQFNFQHSKHLLLSFQKWQILHFKNAEMEICLQNWIFHLWTNTKKQHCAPSHSAHSTLISWKHRQGKLKDNNSLLQWLL